ncbi:hypothetical protein SAMN04489727_7361 [Amycolatopsis tolypomycina]|uniref:Uncharacterized protein n=1 Tax=Amycolatopsis tolypomycina TaxID=208445 RepID=A0A1H4ZPK7_9PSEU|nr:hypothetical protein [Amycolatopsis tolypomycina]SED31290.1 hypothetical protein SAMN04489727_7361 [Amycolatopsis tolypomycina]
MGVVVGASFLFTGSGTPTLVRPTQTLGMSTPSSSPHTATESTPAGPPVQQAVTSAEQTPSGPPKAVTTVPAPGGPATDRTKGPGTPGSSTRTGVSATTPPKTSVSPAARQVEVGGNKNGSPTFTDTKALRPGPRPVGYLEAVEVSCKVYDTTIESASPGGYWYRLAGYPWNNGYYAVANTFTNGDTPGDPQGPTDFDPAVPDC